MPAFDPSRALSRRTSKVEEAAIIAMAQKAREMKAAGTDVVSLTLGEPDFDTPQFIREAATAAMNEGFTHYAPIAGFPDLRQAIAEKLNKENNLYVSGNNVVVTNGAKQAITNACFATLDDGDEVILMAPFWAAYEGIVKMAGGTPVVVAADARTDFKVPAERIAQAMTSRTRLILLNSPCNPSGAVWTREELEQLAGVVMDHPDCLVLSDEIYEYIWFEAKPVSIAALEGMADRTITVNGFSKGFAMTGWRVGYAAAAEPIARAMAKVQGTFTAGGNAFAQRAALAAITADRSDVEAMRRAYQARRDLVCEALEGLQDVSVIRPWATFYAFPDLSALLGEREGNAALPTDVEFCHWLLERHHLAVVPGSAFGCPGCIRLSFAASKTDIEDGLSRLAAATRELA